MAKKKKVISKKEKIDRGFKLFNMHSTPVEILTKPNYFCISIDNGSIDFFYRGLMKKEVISLSKMIESHFRNLMSGKLKEEDEF